MYCFSLLWQAVYQWASGLPTAVLSNPYACVLSHVWLLVTTWTVARQDPLFMGFPRQEHWSGLPFPTPEDLSDPRIEAVSLVPPALSGRFFTTVTAWEVLYLTHITPFESESISHSVVSNSLRPHGLQPTRLLCPWDFFRQENWSGLPFPTPEDLPNPGIEPMSPVSPSLACGFFTTAPPWKPSEHCCLAIKTKKLTQSIQKFLVDIRITIFVTHYSEFARDPN